MDSHLEKQNPKVWVLTKASPEKVVTTINFNTPNPSLRHKKLTINLNEYQQKLVQFDNNKNKVLMDYMHQLQAIITKQSTLISAENKQSKEEGSHQENCNSNSYNAIEANQTADFFNSLTQVQKKHVKEAHSKHNVRGITGYSEYLKNINM
ncbi:hypothetical protein GCM10011501_33940 [Thalassotalea profundi]|uniref:Uncharacterized protein n=2 Tax=Thalassotalea profundi TaxID=2036687 RepID=A0ABQ3J3P8_9GAMM|nr:hypothetical protein GCM10011501_33940 [Thalassotalea profundi]